jgi:hypothetical protein
VLQDQDGNNHDAVISGSIVTREAGYDCRFTLQFPYESQEGTANDAVVKRGSISTTRFIAFSDSVTGYAGDYSLFQAVGKNLGAATSGLSIGGLANADLWAELTADFAKMFTDVVQVASSDSNLRDPEAAYITSPRPQLSGANS